MVHVRHSVLFDYYQKGKAGKASVSYSGNARYAGPNHLPDLMNSYQFANYFNEGSINGGGKAILMKIPWNASSNT